MSEGDASPEALLALITERRSERVLVEPGPTSEELERILLAGTTVPDHGRLKPWRFVVIEGEGRATFASGVASATKTGMPELPDELIEGLRSRLGVAPVLIAVIAAPKESRMPAWEQVVSASLAGYAIHLAANALGYGAAWRSTVFREQEAVSDLLALAPTEELLGWITIGTRGVGDDGEPIKHSPRKPIDLAEFAARLTPDGLVPYSPAAS